ncbi:putative integral membrane protein [Botrytis fragariae]|uniref:Putative integral membrane protein n=1 Tax=Botrytis fragariae TaxID=1964551 RepID=A0A8H6EG45_9HELO|nr:putative integral membrane protein [Botrytis fragariae]KAF5871037.1 putative integral membrane protein [Botrytis fragariae]
MSFTTPIYPGINLEANEGPLLKAVSIAFIALTVCAIAIRFFSRWYTKIPLGLDELFILIAAILSIAYTAVIIVEVNNNFYGQHVHKSDPEHLEAYLKGLYALALLYPIALSTSKLSLLALYWRVFAATGGKVPILFAGAINGAWGVAALFVGIFSCRPIEAFWNTAIAAKCIDYPVFFTSNEAFTIAFDIVVLSIPVWFIAQIKRSIGERITISSTFLLGLVVTVVSAIRLWRLVVAQRLPGFDPTFNEVDAGLWAIIELNLWILVASIPTFRPLLGQIWRDYSEKTNRSGSEESPEYPLSRTRTTGNLFPRQQRDMDLDTEPVFGFDDGKRNSGNPSEMGRHGRNGSSGTGLSGDSGFGESLGVRVVDADLESQIETEIEGWRNAYGYASQKGGGEVGSKQRWSNGMKDLAGIKVQKERDVRRNAGD